MRSVTGAAARKHWGFRLLGICLSLLLVGGQLAALGHLTLVEHSVCAEHGELTHAHGARADRASALPSEQTALSRGAGSDDLGHEHCAFIARAREGLLLPPTTASLAPPQPGAIAQQAACAECHPLGRLAALCVAPKQSPPRA